MAYMKDIFNSMSSTVKSCFMIFLFTVLVKIDFTHSFFDKERLLSKPAFHNFLPYFTVL